MQKKLSRLIRLYACIIGILALLGLMAFFPSVAYAHAYVIGSDPVDGSTIQAVPTVIRIYFDAAIAPSSVAHLYHTENGNFVEVTSALSFVTPHNTRELDIFLPSASTMPQGSYFVRWTALADDDGHTTYGSIGFDVGYSATGLSGVATLGPATSNALDEIRSLDAIGILAIAWQWLTLAALTFWLGLLVTERLVIAHMERGLTLLAVTSKQSRSLQWLCLLALLIGEVVSLVLRVIRFTQATNSGLDVGIIGQLLSTTFYSQLWFVRMVLLLAAVAWLYWTSYVEHKQNEQASREQAARGIITDAISTAQPRVTRDFTLTAIPTTPASVTKGTMPKREPASFPSTLSNTLWLLLAAAIVLTIAFSSDVVTVATLPITAIVLTWFFLLAQGSWLGSMAYTGYVLLPVMQREQLTDTLIVFLRRLSMFILASMGVFLVGGLFLAESTLHTKAQLLGDPYGRILLVAMILTGLLLLFSLYLLFVVRAKLTRQTLLLPVVDAELPARRTRQSALEQTQQQLRRSMEFLSLGSAAIVLCYALMSFYAPPIVFPNVTYSNPASSSNTTVGNMQIQHVGSLSLMLQVLPAKSATTNTVIVIITDSGGVPVTDATVLLRINMTAMDMGTAHATINGGSATYITTFDKNTSLSMAGVWDVLVTVERPNLPPVQALFPVTLT